MSKILCVAPGDNGGGMINLSNALNKYTSHDSRCLTICTSYIDFETDLLWRNYDPGELSKLLSDSDFFIFSEFIPTDVMRSLGLLSKISKNNTVINVGGSYCLKRAQEYLAMWITEGFMFSGGQVAWSLFGKIGRIAPTRNILPIYRMPEKNKLTGPIRVAFSPTKPEKGVTEFDGAMKKIELEFSGEAEAVTITGKSWEESVKIKATCDITFDQLTSTAYAGSAIESMYLQHAVLSKIGPWTRMLRPDLPIISVNNELEIYNEIKSLIENPEKITKLGNDGKEFVLRWHTPKVVSKQWEELIEHVKTM